MNGNLFDTNIVIRLLNGDMYINNIVRELENVSIPITVIGELLFGAENSEHSAKNRLLYEAFCSSFPILNTTIPVAREYGAIAACLKKRGTPIPMNDMWIAATAISYGLRLVTADKHFKNVPNLEMLLV